MDEGRNMMLYFYYISEFTFRPLDFTKGLVNICHMLVWTYMIYIAHDGIIDNICLKVMECWAEASQWQRCGSQFAPSFGQMSRSLYYVPSACSGFCRVLFCVSRYVYTHTYTRACMHTHVHVHVNKQRNKTKRKWTKKHIFNSVEVTC